MADQRINREEELRKILELVAAGDITPEGAAKLLDAIEVSAAGEARAGEPEPARGPRRGSGASRPHRVVLRAPGHTAGKRSGNDLSRELRRLNREARRISHEAQKIARRDMKEAIREAKGEIKDAFKLSVTEARKAARQVETELRRVFSEGGGLTGDFSWLANLTGMGIARDRTKHVAEVVLQEEVGAEDRVSVRNAAGDVLIRGWDERRVEVRGAKTGWGIDKEMAQDRAESMPLEVQRRDGEILVEARPPVPSGIGLFNLQRMKSDLTVMVPRGMAVAVNARGGDITVEEHEGDLSVNTTAGDVVIGVSRGEVDAETVNGDITLRESRARSLALTSLSGDITIYLSPQPGGDYRLRSARGDVRAHIAPDHDIECDLETVSGDLSVGGSFRIVSRGRGRVRCAMGAKEPVAGTSAPELGQARLKFVTISGDASVS